MWMSLELLVMLEIHPRFFLCTFRTHYSIWTHIKEIVLKFDDGNYFHMLARSIVVKENYETYLIPSFWADNWLNFLKFMSIIILWNEWMNEEGWNSFNFLVKSLFLITCLNERFKMIIYLKKIMQL